MEKAKIAAAIEQRFRREFRDTPLIEWTLRHIYIKGKPFSFEGHKYLEELYRDVHPHEVIMKAAQMCMSTRMSCKTFWIGDIRPQTKSLYYFPTDTDVSDFSNDRAKKIIMESPYLSGKVKGVDNVGLKQIGKSTIYFRGMFTKRAVKSVDGDYVVLDELDEASPENIEFAYDRVMHSDLQWISELSQPSIPGYGISAVFEQSDQRYFLLKCPACGHWNNPVETFPGCMIKPLYDPAYLGCENCESELDTQFGEWVAKYPGRTEMRGYQVSQLYSSIIPQGYVSQIDKIYQHWQRAKRKTQKKRIMISIVGVPFAGDEQPITDESIKPALGTHRMLSKQTWSYMGVDVGDTLHAAVGHLVGGGKLCVHWLEEFTDWQKLDALMVNHGVGLCVIDAMPYKNSAKEFARRFPNLVYIQYFKGDTLKEGIEGEGELAVPKVTTDRTESLDDTVDMLKQGDIILPDRSEYEVVETCISHLKMLIKDLKEDSSGNKKYVYKGGVENHFGMALNSMRIAAEIATLQVYGSGLLPAGGSFYKGTH
jgi:hypothetical protein